MSPAPRTDVFWALCRAACYLRGRGVTFGSPLIPEQASNPGVYSLVVGLVKAGGVAALDKNLDLIADGSCDHVLITPMVEALDDPTQLFRQAAAKLRMGGHLVVLVNLYKDAPGCAMFNPDEVMDMVGQVGKWKLKSIREQDDKLLLIAKRLEGKRGIIDMDPLPARKRACVARYGALGDAIIMTPLIRQLAEDGYQVTLNISSYCAPVFENNPHVHNVLIQEKDLIPNGRLGEYWKFWESQYDKYINLSESIEGDLLMVEGRAPFFTTKSWRHQRANRNYYDYTMHRAGYVGFEGARGELFFTNAEERRAEKFWGPLRDKFTAVWALNGSSHHKVYPLFEATLREWFDQHADARVITVGDYTAKLLEFEHPQLIARAGAWSIRESLIATKYADLVIGPETMITNAAGCFPTPKITLLSHSTHENLCKHWDGDYCLAPDMASAPCYPCHQLHYSKESCPLGEVKDIVTGEVLAQAPVCSLAISPERVLSRMEEVYSRWYAAQRAN